MVEDYATGALPDGRIDRPVCAAFLLVGVPGRGGDRGVPHRALARAALARRELAM